MDQRFSILFGAYAEGSIGRRAFMERLGVLAAGAAVLPMLPANRAHAITVLEADPRIKVETVSVPGVNGLSGYLATPTYVNHAKPAKSPAVLIVGESRGLNANIKDLARRYAIEGYVALAVDYLSPVGGTPSDQDLAQSMTFKLKNDDVLSWFKASSKYLAGRADVRKVGVVGYSWGGGVANDLAVEDPNIAAAVTYYSRSPDLKKVAQIKAPIMGHYAALDNATLQGVPAYDEALTKAGKNHTFYIYPGTNNGFSNDTNPARWEPVANKLAFDRNLAFFGKYLA